MSCAAVIVGEIFFGMVDKVSDYEWSSYDIYMGKRNSVLVDEKKILDYFKGRKQIIT